MQLREEKAESAALRLALLGGSTEPGILDWHDSCGWPYSVAPQSELAKQCMVCTYITVYNCVQTFVCMTMSMGTGAPSTVHLILDGDFDSFDKETKSNHMTADIAAALKLDPVRISIGECMAGSIIAQVVVIVCSV